MLGSNLNSAQTGGNLITVNASNVTIDLQGHFLTGSTDPNSSAVGIYANERANLTIRNGPISHCR